MITIKIDSLEEFEQIITVLQKGCAAITDDSTCFKIPNQEFKVDFVTDNSTVQSCIELINKTALGV